MASFDVQVPVAAPYQLVWQRLVDWPRHGDWAPLTRMRVLTERPDGVGARFVAFTGIGRVGFDDIMQITEWQEPDAGRPGRCAVVKQGRVVLGDVQFEVRPSADDTGTVVWHAELRLVPVRLTRYLDPLIAAVARIGYRQALRTMARQLEAELAAGGSGT
jgi:hypothetical protein